MVQICSKAIVFLEFQVKVLPNKPFYESQQNFDYN